MPNLEADDVMGIAQTNGKTPNTVIVSVDKDMVQIPGWHLNPHKQDFPIFITEEEADHTFYMQWLGGDSTDGYGGIKGVGPKKAEKILEYDGDPLLGVNMDNIVLRAYKEADYTRDQAIAQARCARILRACDWDSELRQVIPWEPRVSGDDG
jgi:DNA polymerase-1